MTLSRSRPVPFAPGSVCDTLDATTAARGAMASLQNLIPDPTTRNLLHCRPASMLATDFTGFTTPGFISGYKTIGNRVYGLISTALNAGRDEPFIYDLAADAFIPVTGTNVDNAPASPATFGTWSPPTFAMVGTKLIVTHPGFTGAGAYFGWFDLADPNAPVWDAGNTTPVALIRPPKAVAAFSGRAYFAVNNAVAFSDQLLPTQITNPDQVLTLGDDTPVTALAGLPLQNQLGGIIQSLIAFKGVVVMFQITGDAADTSRPLTVNTLNVATGTAAPASICTTPKGIAFMSPEGVRLIDFGANVSDPIGFEGDGITNPFINAVVPSRICAAYAGDVMRITVQNGAKANSPFEEYWFHIARKIWTGPHTSAASTIAQWGAQFVLALQGVTGKLFKGETVQTSTSTFKENGVQLRFDFTTSFLPNTNEMAECNITESTVNIALSYGENPFFASWLDQNDEVVDVVTIPPTGNETLWGDFDWGDGSLWGGSIDKLAVRQIPWNIPIVFQRGKFSIEGDCRAGVKIGMCYFRYEVLGYLLQRTA